MVKAFQSPALRFQFSRCHLLTLDSDRGARKDGTTHNEGSAGSVYHNLLGKDEACVLTSTVEGISRDLGQMPLSGGSELSRGSEPSGGSELQSVGLKHLPHLLSVLPFPNPSKEKLRSNGVPC